MVAAGGLSPAGFLRSAAMSKQNVVTVAALAVVILALAVRTVAPVQAQQTRPAPGYWSKTVEIRFGINAPAPKRTDVQLPNAGAGGLLITDIVVTGAINDQMIAVLYCDDQPIAASTSETHFQAGIVVPQNKTIEIDGRAQGGILRVTLAGKYL